MQKNDSTAKRADILISEYIAKNWPKESIDKLKGINMRVKILETDERCGVTKGEIYEAKTYWLDPQEKMSLIAREGDGYSPDCNQYKNNLAFWVQGKWMVIDDGVYVPENID